VPGGEVDDQRRPGEHRDLVLLSPREEPIGDSTLIENLDGAREQTARALAGQVLVRPPFNDRDVNPCQRQLTCQHQPRWTASDDHHGVFRHRHTPIVARPCISSLHFRRLGHRPRNPPTGPGPYGKPLGVR
jgi:hypothetical protein